MTEGLSLKEMLADLERRLAFHRAQEAIHAQQETVHRDERGRTATQMCFHTSEPGHNRPAQPHGP